MKSNLENTEMLTLSSSHFWKLLQWSQNSGESDREDGFVIWQMEMTQHTWLSMHGLNLSVWQA